MTRIELIATAPQVVALAVQRGWCTPPVFTPPLTNAQVYRIRHRVNPHKWGALFDDFLKFTRQDFDKRDLGAYMERSGHKVSPEDLATRLAEAAKRGRVIRVTMGRKGNPSVYRVVLTKPAA